MIVDDTAFNLMVLEEILKASFPNAILEKAINGSLALAQVLECD